MKNAPQVFNGEVVFRKVTARDLTTEHEGDGYKFRIHKFPKRRPRGFSAFANWVPYMTSKQIAAVVSANLHKEKEPLVRVTGTVVEWRDAP